MCKRRKDKHKKTIQRFGKCVKSHTLGSENVQNITFKVRKMCKKFEKQKKRDTFAGRKTLKAKKL